MENESLNGFFSGVITVATAIVGVAALAVILSRNSNTANVVQNLGSAMANNLAVAESPVTNAVVTANTSYAGAGISSNLDGFF